MQPNSMLRVKLYVSLVVSVGLLDIYAADDQRATCYMCIPPDFDDAECAHEKSGFQDQACC